MGPTWNLPLEDLRKTHSFQVRDRPALNTAGSHQEQTKIFERKRLNLNDREGAGDIDIRQ